LGPALAGLLGQTSLGLNLPISLALGTSIFALFLIIFFLPESHPREVKEQIENLSIQKSLGHGTKDCFEPEKPAKMTLRKALAMDHVPLLLAIYFVFFLAFSLFVASMPLYATESLHWSIAETGIFFSVLSVVIVITEGPILSWFNKRTSAESLTIWGTFIVSLAYFALLVPSPAFAYSAAVLYALGNGLMWPAFLSLLSDRAGETHQGYIQGIGNSAGSLASIAGLLVGGILFTAMKGGVFIVPALLILVVFAMTLKLRTGKKNRDYTD
jgi:MFS family permease